MLQRTSARSVCRVALGALRRMTKKIKRAQNIVYMRKIGYRQFSNKQFQKQMKRINKIAEDDDRVNEFFSYAEQTPVGGEYIMPVAAARDRLKDIYGDEPSLQGIQTDDDAREQEEEFTGLEEMRRKKRPSKGPGARPRKSQLNVGNLPGISKYIGSLPKHVLTSRPGHLSVVGGSQSDNYQDVWMSGASVSYEFEAEDEMY